MLQSANGRASVPLRAYGKLALTAEYLRVGCDDHPAATEYARWIDDGFKWAEAVCGRRGFHVQNHRIVFTHDRGRLWIIACIWDSADVSTEQGGGRRFPFTLFAILPAGDARRDPHSVACTCGPIWQELEVHFSELGISSDRTDFTRRVRARGLALGPQSDFANQLMLQAKNLPLTTWLSGALDGTASEALLFARLQTAILELENAPLAGQGWVQLPMSANLDKMVQLDSWIGWLALNAPRTLSDYSILLPSVNGNRGCSLWVSPRAPQPDGFLLLSQERDHIRQVLGDRQIMAIEDEERSGESLLNALRGNFTLESGTLFDLAGCRFPRPSMRPR